MLRLYQICASAAEGLFSHLLNRRALRGKEDIQRLEERRGHASLPRPAGSLIWLHAASVGEAQSALILIKEIINTDSKAHILVTTGTVTSAALMAKNLPERAFHQYYPLDHPSWVKRFLDHWQPDLVLWMESELWPNMLLEIKARKIRAALINARLSERSYRRWKLFKKSIRQILQSFSLILTQTKKDEHLYKKLGGEHVIHTDNLKFSAAPLSVNDEAFKAFMAQIAGRPLWLFASTHEGEEEMACRVHEVLKSSFENLLTIIIPRHPVRGRQISAQCRAAGLKTVSRGNNHTMPAPDTDIYIADTLGELGLFYRAALVACIGRSFSDDGGGGHNPIEAAQLGCAVLHGPNVQNLQVIYDEMHEHNAAIECKNEQDLTAQLHEFLCEPLQIEAARKRAYNFARTKDQVLGRVMSALAPFLSDISGPQNSKGAKQA